MKMEAYYAVVKWTDSDTVDYLAGPFRWYGEAYDAVKEGEKDGLDCVVVSFNTNVELA